MTPEVRRARDVLRSGGLVAIPTETVYGLAADAGNAAAVNRIFDVKRRPRGHPLIVHIPSVDTAGEWAEGIPAEVAVLMGACWPGPLTVIVPRAAHVLDEITGGRSTVGLRVPSHPLTQELLAVFGGGLAAPSANRFGRVSPTTADHVRRDLGADVDYVLDGGPCAVGLESTIVDCTVAPCQILRSGGIPDDHVRALLGGALAERASGPSRASGMLESHYAPGCAVVLVEWGNDPATAASIATGPVRVLDCSTDLPTAARTLYTELRRADLDGIEWLVVVLPPAEGLGYAIRDRLFKAAAPRPTG